MLTGYSFSFTCVQSLYYFTISMHYFYDAKTHPKCFVFNMCGVLTKIFWNNKLSAFLVFWVKGTHFWKRVWIHTIKAPIFFLILFNRDFLTSAGGHHLSSIQAAASWNADNYLSHDPKTSREDLVRPAKYSCSSLVIRKRTNHRYYGSWVLGMPKTTSAMRYTAPLALLWNSGPELGSLWSRTYLPHPGPSNLRGILEVWLFSGSKEYSMYSPHKRTGLSTPQETQGLGMSRGRSTSPGLLSAAPPQPTQSWKRATPWSAYKVGKAKNRRPERVTQSLHGVWPIHSVALSEAQSCQLVESCLLRQPVLRTRREAEDTLG